MRKGLKYIIALVWLINGLLCKVLHLVPRHQEIVATIVSKEYAPVLTMAIGVSEILLAIWILLDIKVKAHTYLQIALITTMNILEFILVPELLLWGKLNSLFALLLVGLVYFHFHRYKKEENDI